MQLYVIQHISLLHSLIRHIILEVFRIFFSLNMYFPTLLFETACIDTGYLNWQAELAVDRDKHCSDICWFIRNILSIDCPQSLSYLPMKYTRYDIHIASVFGISETHSGKSRNRDKTVKSLVWLKLYQPFVHSSFSNLKGYGVNRWPENIIEQLDRGQNPFCHYTFIISLYMQLF